MLCLFRVIEVERIDPGRNGESKMMLIPVETLSREPGGVDDFIVPGRERVAHDFGVVEVIEHDAVAEQKMALYAIEDCCFSEDK